MAKVVHTGRSRSDLREIWAYIAQDSERAADRVLSEIARRIELLGRYPNRGFSSDVRPGLRYLISHPYRIVYRYEPGENLVTIVAIVHGRRDLPSAL